MALIAPGVKGIVRKIRWMDENTYGGLAGNRAVKQGQIISNALTGITPRANPAERTGEDDTIGPRRRRPLGPRRKGYGRGLGGIVRSVMQPRP